MKPPLFMKPTKLAVVVAPFLLSLALPTSLVRAEDEAPQEDVSSTDDEAARALYVSGERHYAAGRYEEAASDFLQSYELSKRPDLLFNVANAYERLSDYESAAVYLEEYLGTPDASNEVSVRQRIRRLRMNAKKREQEDKDIAELARLEPSGGNQSEGASRVLPYSLLGGGALLVGGGLVAGLVSRNAGSDAEKFCTSSGLCETGAKSSLDRERNFGILADVAIGAGVVVAGVGVFLLLTGDKESRAARVSGFRFDLTPQTDGLQLGVSREF